MTTTNLVEGAPVSAEELVDDLAAVCGEERLREYAEAVAEGRPDDLDAYYGAVQARNGIGDIGRNWREALEIIEWLYL